MFKKNSNGKGVLMEVQRILRRVFRVFSQFGQFSVTHSIITKSTTYFNLFKKCFPSYEITLTLQIVGLRSAMP